MLSVLDRSPATLPTSCIVGVAVVADDVFVRLLVGFVQIASVPACAFSPHADAYTHMARK